VGFEAATGEAGGGEAASISGAVVQDEARARIRMERERERRRGTSNIERRTTNIEIRNGGC
jgi:hypothetical protein